MRFFVFCLISILFVGRALAGAEWVSEFLITNVYKQVEVPSGKIIETKTPISSGTVTNQEVSLYFDGGTKTMTNSGYGWLSNPGQFVGPVTVSIFYTGAGKVLIQYRIIDNPEIPVVIPNGVSVPASNTQSYKVDLESSTNMTNWVKAMPGTYVKPGVKTFFRIKVEGQ